MKQAYTKIVKFEDIKPYWRNPRENESTVAQLTKSVDKFGYINRILIDDKNVIIAGHSRWKAMKQLHYTGDIEVLCVDDWSDDQKKEFRILDNKIGEQSTWTDDLFLELRELPNTAFMQQFFSFDLNAEISAMTGKSIKPVTNENVAKISDDLGKMAATAITNRKEIEHDVMCPKCGHEFIIRSTGH